MARLNIQRIINTATNRKTTILLPQKKNLTSALNRFSFCSAYLCKGVLESPCTTISPSLSYLCLTSRLTAKNTPVPPQHTRESKTTTAGQAYGTQTPNPFPSHAPYITDQMTTKRAPGGWDERKKEEGERRGKAIEREEAAVRQEVNDWHRHWQSKRRWGEETK